MIDSRKLCGSVCRTRPSTEMAMMAAGTIWMLILLANVGAQSAFNRLSHAIRATGRRPVAKVISFTGPSSIHWNGRPRPLVAGSDLKAGEVIVTGAYATVLIGTGSGGEFRIFPGSLVTFSEDRRMWLDQVDRWLDGIKAHIQRFGGPALPDRLSCPTAVMGVRAAVLPSLVKGAIEFEKRWIERRRRV